MSLATGAGRPFAVTAVAGSATPLSSNKRTVVAAVLRFPSANTDDVVVGDANILSTDPAFPPGSSIAYNQVDSIKVDLAKIFVRSVSGSQQVEVHVQAG